MEKSFKIVVIFLIAFVISCSSDDDATNTNTTPVETQIRVTSLSTISRDYEFCYDDEGRLIKYELRYQLNGVIEEVEIEYDTSGRIIKNGGYEYHYNAEGLVDEVISNTSIYPGRYEFTYDIFGNLIEIERYDTADEIRNRTTYEYNDSNQLIRRISLSVDQTTGIISYSGQEYTRDVDGNVTFWKLQNSTDGITFTDRSQKFTVYSNIPNPQSLLQKSLYPNGGIMITSALATINTTLALETPNPIVPMSSEEVIFNGL